MQTKKMVFMILLGILALVAAQLLAQLIASMLFLVKIPSFICNALAGILYVAIAYWLLRLLCKKYLKEDMEAYCIPKFRVEAKWIIIAIALPILVSVAFLLLNGSFEENAMDLNAKLDALTAGIFFTGFGAGFVEEMVFRGIIMGVVEKRFNRKVAVIAPSVLFGFVHILGMGYDLLSCIFVVFAGTMVGVMFSLIALEKKSVWNSAIVHAIWNIVISGIGTACDEYSLYSYVLETNSFLLTGGDFGIESSVIAVMGYCLVSAYVILSNRKRR